MICGKETHPVIPRKKLPQQRLGSLGDWLLTMRKIYFVDTENVASRWLPLLDGMTKDDRVLLFCTASSPNLPLNYSMITRLLSCRAAVENIPCCNGTPNALDFQLVSELGRRIEKSRHSPCQFVIVTGDKGFDAVVSYWTARSYNVVRESCAPAQPTKKVQKTTVAKMPEKKVSSPNEFKNLQVQEDYEKRLQEISIEEKYINVLLPILMGAMKKTQRTRKQAVYMGICQKYGVADGAVLYRRIQPLVREIASGGPIPV